jgi:CRP-like cAMP-binding protein/cytochrome P450
MPLLGSTLALLKDPSGFLVRAYEELGPVFRVAAFGKEYTIMAGQEAFHFFLTVGERHFSRELFYRRFAHELGTECFVLGAQGQQHSRLRKMMKLGFSRHVASAYIPSMTKAIEERVRAWEPNQQLHVMDTMADLAFECYTLVMAGHSLGEYFRDAFYYSNTIMKVGAMVRPSLLLHLPAYRKAKARVFSLMNELLAGRRGSTTDDRQFDLFDAVLGATDAEGRSFSDADMIATALYGFVGTLVYMNRLLSYLVFEILKDPALQQKISAEADVVFASAPLNAMALRKMDTCYSAYLESLRFHPVPLGLPFLVEEDFEFAGYLIKRGQRVVLSPLPMHFSAKFYSNPATFDHKRCAEPRYEHHARGAFAPFGFGGRVCAAVGLVEVISMVVIGALLRNLHLQLEPPDYRVRTELDPLPGPEAAFRMRVLEHRQLQLSPQPLPEVEERVTTAIPGMGSHELNEILAKAKSVEYSAGEIIIREGDVAAEFFIILDGQVEVFKNVHQPREHQQSLAQIGPGEFFGEIGLLRKVPRTASVRAMTPVRILVLDRNTFITFVSECDLVSEQIADLARRRLMSTRLAEVLPQLSQQQLNRLLPNFTLARFRPGDAIVHQGDPADLFYIIVSGRVEVVNHRPGGEDLILGELGAGEWFGEMALLLGRTRTATVRAAGAEDVEVMGLDRENFQRLMAESEAANFDVASVMFKRLLSSQA